MGFLRRRRRPQLDLAALDRLSDTIARAVALIEGRLAASPGREEPGRRGDLVIRRGVDRREPEPEPERPPSEPWTEPRPQVPEAAAAAPEPAPPAGFVLLVPTAAGYRLAMPDGITPEPGERLSVEEKWFRVLRLGPSPLPGDVRRCVFLEPCPTTLE